ncbi:MAG: glycosyltransferase family 4 protein [Methylocystis sp.]|uniref:glycosyltransferase family 4 protein n=1 Tax=Methylocystis sp. TaxID=1911079 RepID=UPI003DA4923C
MLTSVNQAAKNLSSFARNLQWAKSLATRQPGLAIYGFFSTENGLGKAARTLAEAYKSTGLPLSCHALSSGHTKNEIFYPSAGHLENRYDMALLAINANAILQEHLRGLVDPSCLSHNRKIGLFFWELPVFPGIWTRAIEDLVEIWVPSAFVANSLKTATSKRVRVIPLPVQINNLDQTMSREELRLPPDRPIFLTTFDFSSYPERKNPLGAIRAFIDAFPGTAESSPLMVVKCHGSAFRNRYERELKTLAASNANIRVIDAVMSPVEIAQLQAATDVFVSLHRSEGFGLNLAECMAAGKLVIGTKFSGNLDFMTPANSLLVDFDMRRVREGEYIAWEGQWWAEPKHDAAVELFRFASHNADLRRKLGRAARETIRSELSFEKVGSMMARSLDEIRVNCSN